MLHSPGNINFWNLLSFLILKHYLSIKFGGVNACKKLFYYATFLYHFSLYKCTYKILPILQTSGIATHGRLVEFFKNAKGQITSGRYKQTIENVKRGMRSFFVLRSSHPTRLPILCTGMGVAGSRDQAGC